MVLVCFLLDLRSVSPPLFRDLKQSRLQLANFYTISSNLSKSDSLRDRIGLCYVIKNRISSSDEVTPFDLIGDVMDEMCFDLKSDALKTAKVAYGPRGDFTLRDFHHAVHSLPTDSFSQRYTILDLSLAMVSLSLSLAMMPQINVFQSSSFGLSKDQTILVIKERISAPLPDVFLILTIAPFSPTFQVSVLSRMSFRAAALKFKES
ncbi:hypothetical protein CRYUN_Cryun07bG0012300 [Craigia yunnanensis]